MPVPVFGAAGTFLAGATATSAAVAAPPGVSSGQVVLCHLYKENSAAVTAPAGFSEVLTAPTTTANIPHTLHLFAKRATGNDTGTYTFSWTGSNWREAVATRFTGCIGYGSPIHLSSSAQDSGFVSVTPAVSFTTTLADQLLVWFGGIGSTGNWTPPTNFTERFDSANTISVATRDWATAGATGSVTGTSAGANSTTAWLVSLIGGDHVGKSRNRRWPGVGPGGTGFRAPRRATGATVPPVDASTAPYVVSQYSSFH